MKGRMSFLFSLLIAAYSSGIAAQRTDCENASVADIVFLVDGSSSIGPNSFQEVRTFLRTIIKALDIGPNKVRIGVAQFSDAPQKEFWLKDHMDKKSLLAAVERIPYREGGTKTGEAMDFLRTTYFTKQAGSRVDQRVPQIAVVITDGGSNDDVVVPAKKLRQQGVIVFGIGVGEPDRSELESIANWPPDRFLHSIDSYQALQRLTEVLLPAVCDSVNYQREALADRFADIFFLVDSGIAQGQFSMFRADLTKLINQLNAGADTYRVGLAQYGQRTKVEFLLNAFQTRQDILNAVRGFRLQSQPNQPRKLGSALQYAKSNFFTRAAGGRAHLGSRQFLVVVSGKDSDDPVSRDAQNLKSTGVTVVGMSAGASMDVLDLFVSSGYAFPSPRVLLLKDYFLTPRNESITEDCKAAKADIVFIVDESRSIGTTNFQLVRSFLHSIVSSLEVGLNKVRVGIVTYNESPTARVYLNTFNDKAEILQFINFLPYSRGGTNTGAALNFTLEEIFVDERGSREDKDVQKVAVVITDGESSDKVSEAAVILRRAGVTIYSVGVENANMAELVEMATHPPDRHVFNVENFTDLKVLKQSLQKIMCENIIDRAITSSARATEIKKACVQKDEADIFFLIDDSGSIGNLDFKDMQDFIIKFLRTFHIGPEHVRVGLVKYADNPTQEFDLTAYSDANKMEEAVKAIIHEGGGTETGKALLSMGQHFDRAKATRGHEVPEYLIVITDGESTDAVKAPAEKLRAQGVIIYAIGVKESNEEELQEIAGDPKRSVFVSNFDALKSINSDIITDICSEDACKDIEGDIFFLTDSSYSISTKDFQTMKDFMKSVIGKLAVGQNKVHVGVMQFSTNYNLEFPLNRYYSIDEISKAIDVMKQIDEGTLTGKAITEVSQYFDQTRGGRPGLSQRLIVITDGEATDDVISPAEALRKKGVAVYAIGVEDANTTQLLEISGSSDRMYVEKDFDALSDLESQVALKICKKVCTIEKADIIFLLDASGSIDETEFESMRLFMESVVNETTVEKDQTRFGLISFSDVPKHHFSLNTHHSKRKVLAALPKTRPKGLNTYTGEAMEFSLPYFNAEHGGRKALKVPQILMVITDGNATNPHILKTTSDALRDNGVIVLSIGVKDAYIPELMTMAGNDDSKVFYVDNFKALETLYKNISSTLCKTTKKDCRTSDVVFLLDQSSSIKLDQYDIMKNFTADVVNTFPVSKEFVHVGLARFSDHFKDEFYLDQSFEKDYLVSRINALEYKGGDTYIGKALHEIKEYFLESRGCRRDVPKNLVLITDGDSDEDRDIDVEDAAGRLKELDIDLFAIGVGDVHALELLQITGDPERLFNVRNFHGLKNIKHKVVDALCQDDPDPVQPTTAPPPTPPTTAPPPTPPPTGPLRTGECTIDIAMGFDISQRTGAPGEMLVSGHKKLESFLPEIVHYVSSVPDLCCIRPATVKTKITFQVVGRDGRFLNDTYFEDNSKDVLDKVMNVKLSEPTYFNTALLNSFKEKFKVKSKAKVKVLVIFSDGLDEDVEKLKHESELLRQSGVSALLTVALEGVRDPAELQMVEFGRGFGYKLPLSIGMPSVGNNILKQIDTVAERECCNVTCKCSGHEGPRGLWGPPGPKGSSGLKGQRGFPGEEGVSGDRGSPGPSGPQGIEGCPGARGQKGYRGVSGNRGEDGEDGLDGINGEQGLTGRDGEKGERGDPGNSGIPGIRGGAGLKGQRGLRGDPGETGADNTVPGAKGDPGNPGLPGLSGKDGRAGGDGGKGNPGPDGRRGPPGEQGASGDPGEPGLPGSPGAPGPQGRRGKTGDVGPKGISGFPGPQGGPGLAGDRGTAGRRGPNGQKGQPGEPGVKGAPGSVGPIGMPGQDGKDGYGPAGPPGVKGDPGFPGYPGLMGEDGQRGTKGYPGPKGNQGRGGNSGGPGEPGVPGEPGHPGHRGPRGPPGERTSVCQLITNVRHNCACYHGESECPAYPTELVFGLDMSTDVTPVAFERQRSALLSLLEDIAISESNCPTGARVAVVGYNEYAKTLIRFQEYRRKTQLIEAVKNIALERTSNKRHLGAAMRFVGQNVFKRVRAGVLIRKVAVFLSNGPAQDSSEIVTAMMEYRGLNIVPAVISLKNAPAVSQAMEVDDTKHYVFTVLGRDIAADLKKVKNCAICYDPCRRSEMCAFIQEPLQPQEVDVDLVMVADSSREMQTDEFAGVQQLLGSVVEQLAVSPQPRRAGNQARVAVVQQSGTQAPKVEFGLGTYQNHNLMRRHLLRNVTLQGGSSALGRTLEFTLKEVLLKAAQPRRMRALLAVVGTRTAYEDRAKLRYISQKAKCEGVALFVVTVGERYDRAQVEELASAPVLQHLIHVGRLKADEQGYAQRFFRVFLSALSKGKNVYPPPSLKQTCDQLPDEERRIQKRQGTVELRDEFVEQMGGQTLTRQLDVSDALTRGDEQSFLSAESLNDPNILTKQEPTSFVSKDICLLRQDAGGCKKYIVMWFFDNSLGRCSRFWYSGCGGNENRFETQNDCQKLCPTKTRLGGARGRRGGGAAARRRIG